VGHPVPLQQLAPGRTARCVRQPELTLRGVRT
jgi:hypothetical protein